jgi:phospholipid transport system substrate-binding protein
MQRSLIGMACLLLSTGIAEATVDERDPSSIISEVSKHIITVLNNRRAEFTENPELLTDVVRENLLPLIDLEYSARLILGRSGRGISAQQLSEFSKAVSNILIERYSQGLLDYKSEELMEVMPMRGKNSDKLTRVRTRIKLSRGGFVPVDFAFRKTDQGWKTFDVTVEGISYVITFRNQIAPRVQADGIDKVSADLSTGSLKINE